MNQCTILLHWQQEGKCKEEQHPAAPLQQEGNVSVTRYIQIDQFTKYHFSSGNQRSGLPAAGLLHRSSHRSEPAEGELVLYIIPTADDATLINNGKCIQLIN